MSTITLQNLWKTFGGQAAIRGADLTVHEGEFVTLLGESGCGKTTTLRCIAGLENPTTGRITIGDTVMFDGEAKIAMPPELRNIGMMFQSYALWPHMTVEANVAYPLRRRKVPKSQAQADITRALAVVGLESFRRRRPSELSGGQQQRVALARAIVAAPEVMLYDEPLSNLDPSLRRSIRDQIKKLHALGGRTSVYVTHDLEEAMHLSDRIVVMQSGLLEQTGTPQELSEKPATEYVARFVGFENILEGVIRETTNTSCAADVHGFGVISGLPLPAFDIGQGDRIGIAVRGVNIAFGEASNYGLPGVLRETTYLGVRTEFRVSVGSKMLTIVRSEGEARSALTMNIGDPVTVEIIPEYCSVVRLSDLPLSTAAIQIAEGMPVS